MPSGASPVAKNSCIYLPFQPNLVSSTPNSKSSVTVSKGNQLA